MRDGSMPFLDCEISVVGGRLKTKVYRKPTHSGAYINYQSNHSKHTKEGIIRILTKRATKYCEEQIDLKEELKTIRKEFESNGYPRNEINRIVERECNKQKEKKKVRWMDEQPENNKKMRWMVIDRIPKFSDKIRRICSKFDIKLIEKPTHNIEQTLRKKSHESDPVGVIL
jgi:L-lactate utilization protein LutB